MLAIRLGLALVFGVAAATKSIDRRAVTGVMRDFGLQGPLAAVGASALPVAEAAIVVGLLVSVSAWWALAPSVILIAVFIAAIAWSMVRGVSPDCHCFGQLHSQPVGAACSSVTSCWPRQRVRPCSRDGEHRASARLTGSGRAERRGADTCDGFAGVGVGGGGSGLVLG